MPALSPTMIQGNIQEWKKKEGDEVSAGDVLAEIETDKAVISWESTEDGFLAKILVPEKTEGVPVGKLVAILVESKDDVSAFASFTASGDEEKPSAQEKATPEKPQSEQQVETPKKPAPPSSTQAPPPQPGRVGQRIVASPAAKVAAATSGKDLSSIQGTGPNNRIVKADVEHATATSAAVTSEMQSSLVETQEYTDIPNSQIRKVIASRLTESKQKIPHYYLTIDCNVDKLMALRSQLNKQAKDKYKLSVNDFVIKCAALSMKDVPEANSTWTDSYIRRFHQVHINVAVSTDHGLFTPLIQNADSKGLVAITNHVKELAAKAQAQKLTTNELAIGTFTISNLGMFGIKQFAAVINPPQSCILAVGGVENRVVATDDPNEKYKVSQFMSVTLSCDHRVIDGAVGAKWLQSFKAKMEDPVTMIL